MKLKDKIAIVTGNSHGIGRNIAVRLTKEGARWVIGQYLEVSGGFWL